LSRLAQYQRLKAQPILVAYIDILKSKDLKSWDQFRFERFISPKRKKRLGS